MSIYEENKSVSFYNSGPAMLLPPIIGLGHGLDSRISHSLPPFNTPSIASFNASVNSPLSSLVLGIATGQTNLPSALTQLYHHQQAKSLAISVNGLHSSVEQSFPFGAGMCSNRPSNDSSNGSCKSTKSCTSSESNSNGSSRSEARGSARKERNGSNSNSNSNSTCGSNGSNSGNPMSSEGESDVEAKEASGAGGEGRVSRECARREYHKKIERKRRDRTRSLYEELRGLTRLNDFADKNAVLEGAIALIDELKQRNLRLEEELRRAPDDRRCRSPGAAAEAAVGGSPSSRPPSRSDPAARRPASRAVCTPATPPPAAAAAAAGECGAGGRGAGWGEEKEPRACKKARQGD